MFRRLNVSSLSYYLLNFLYFRKRSIEVSAEHRRIAEILGKQNRLEVPALAKERVLAAVNAISRIVTVHSDIGGVANVEEVPAQTKPHVHLLPAGSGLKVALLSRPFAQGGPGQTHLISAECNINKCV